MVWLFHLNLPAIVDRVRLTEVLIFWENAGTTNTNLPFFAMIELGRKVHCTIGVVIATKLVIKTIILEMIMLRLLKGEI